MKPLFKCESPYCPGFVAEKDMIESRAGIYHEICRQKLITKREINE